MSYSPIGDTVAATRLAYIVYSKVWKVARDAPDQFGQLSQDLQIFKNILHQVRDQVNHDTDPTYSTLIKDILHSCFETLYSVRDLTTSLERSWSIFLASQSEQNAIKEFRAQFARQQQSLQLVLTVDGRKHLQEARNRDGSIGVDEASAVDRRPSGRYDKRQGSLQSIRRNGTVSSTDTETTLQDPRDSLSHVSRVDTRKASSFGQHDGLQPSTTSRSLSTSTVPTNCTCRIERSERPQLDEIDTDISPQSPSLHQLSISSPVRTRQPLNLSEDREKHDVCSQMQLAFRKSYEALQDTYSTESWLRLATWWLVKSRTVCRALVVNGAQRRGTDTSLHQDGWAMTISAAQAYTDLLKSSWILEEVVLAKPNQEDLQYTNIRRIIMVLVDSLDRDLRDRRWDGSESPSFADDVLLKQDLGLLEGFEQTIELAENFPDAINDFEPAHRWFEPDQDNAGVDTERVLYRTFVNAQLGSRVERSKSSSAPYMILLWTSADESDLLITLCNHRGTVNLSRKLTAKDLETYREADGHSPLAVDFPSKEAEIKFLSPQDLEGFFTRPKEFFAAMKVRNPHPLELAILQAPIASYCDSTPDAHDTSGATIASTKTSACGLTMYESMPESCWRTTRRLVIHSAPDSTKPSCASHWLPLHHVRVLVDGLKVTVKWSDCGQLNISKPVNTVQRYSWVYKSEEPNRSVDLEFRSSTDALKFRESLLYLTDMPPRITLKLAITTAFQDVRMYRLFDADEPDVLYHGLAITRKSPQAPFMTEFFCPYQDLDWTIETKNGVPSIINFSQLHSPHYTSTRPSQTYPPDLQDPLLGCEDVVDRIKPARVELGCDHDLIRFMRGLTGWRLKYFRRIVKFVIIEKRSIKNKSKDFCDVDVHLWEKASEEGRSKTQLAVRFEGKVIERWITASLVDNGMSSNRDTIEIRGVAVKRGVWVDSRSMTAKRATEETEQGGRFEIALTFRGTGDKEEFVRLSGLY